MVEKENIAQVGIFLVEIVHYDLELIANIPKTYSSWRGFYGNK